MLITKQGVFIYFPVEGTQQHYVHWSGWEFGAELGETLPATEEQATKARLSLVLEHIARGIGLEPPARTATTHRAGTLVLLPTRPGPPPATDGGTTKESANGDQEENPGAVDGGSDRGSDGVKEGATGQENAAQEEGSLGP